MKRFLMSFGSQSGPCLLLGLHGPKGTHFSAIFALAGVAFMIQRTGWLCYMIEWFLDGYHGCGLGTELRDAGAKRSRVAECRLAGRNRNGVLASGHNDMTWSHLLGW